MPLADGSASRRLLRSALSGLLAVSAGMATCLQAAAMDTPAAVRLVQTAAPDRFPRGVPDDPQALALAASWTRHYGRPLPEVSPASLAQLPADIWLITTDRTAAETLLARTHHFRHLHLGLQTPDWRRWQARFPENSKRMYGVLREASPRQVLLTLQAWQPGNRLFGLLLPARQTADKPVWLEASHALGLSPVLRLAQPGEDAAPLLPALRLGSPVLVLPLGPETDAGETTALLRAGLHAGLQILALREDAVAAGAALALYSHPDDLAEQALALLARAAAPAEHLLAPQRLRVKRHPQAPAPTHAWPDSIHPETSPP